MADPGARRVALVTGGGTGIGRACAQAFAASGVDVVVNYSRSADDAEATCAAASRLGVHAMAWAADVSDDAAVRAMVGGVLEQHGRLDYLVNNAGCTQFVDSADLDGLRTEDWDRVMSVNVRGSFQTARAAMPLLQKSGGAVVNVGSTAGLTGRGSSIAYAASKAALGSLTKSLALVAAPHVRVNAVAPGIVETRWVDGREDHVRRLAEDTPLGRVCQPEEVAQVICFLATTATFVTGQTLIVDGGRFL